MAEKKKRERQPIPIIDLFAGPGGLGEGFMSVTTPLRERRFKIALSIEKEEFAHQTLTLRSFVRQFRQKDIPDDYYRFLTGEITQEHLYSLYPDQLANAKHEAWKTTLGKDTPHNELDERIVNALGGKTNWVLIGGPPCQAYSIVGRARRKEKQLDPDDERVYLYREYYRILAAHNPPVFVMENVKGLLSSKVNDDSIFRLIIEDLEDPVLAFNKLNRTSKNNFICPGYDIYSFVKKPLSLEISGRPVYETGDFIIKSEDYGIPQTRHRLILFGVRKDLGLRPDKILIKQKKLIPISKVLDGLPSLRSGLSRGEDTKSIWKETLEYFTANGILSDCEKMVRDKINKTVKNLRLPQRDRGSRYIEYFPFVTYNAKWYIDKKLKGICNHESRGHIEYDLYRYMFVSCFAKIHKRSPVMSEFPKALLPAHENVKEAIDENKFSDRFRVQLSNQPAKTITSHISKDGHYYIHHDPAQCRSLTVREAARIQTFPDNYFFCGPRTAQYEQVGNAVPPFLAFQIARIVSVFFERIENLI
jgi:DNA (cytosine-5)-methyltransferase 1